MKQVLLGFVLGLVILGTITVTLIGCHHHSPPPVVPPPGPQIIMPPPAKPERVYSASFVRGYHDGYSGAWLAPARWCVRSEYRAGWTAGCRDRENGKPNVFLVPKYLGFEEHRVKPEIIH